MLKNLTSHLFGYNDLILIILAVGYKYFTHSNIFFFVYFCWIFPAKILFNYLRNETASGGQASDPVVVDWLGRKCRVTFIYQEISRKLTDFGIPDKSQARVRFEWCEDNKKKVIIGGYHWKKNLVSVDPYALAYNCESDLKKTFQLNLTHEIGHSIEAFQLQLNGMKIKFNLIEVLACIHYNELEIFVLGLIYSSLFVIPVLNIIHSIFNVFWWIMLNYIVTISVPLVFLFFTLPSIAYNYWSNHEKFANEFMHKHWREFADCITIEEIQ